MSGIYIPGTEMPTNCNTCNFHALRFCFAADKDLAEKDTRPLIERRPDFCPLVPVPEHGRLIDADAFERRCMFDPAIEDMQDVIYALRDYPTIIPADPAKEGEG